MTILHATAILATRDLQTAERFYVEILGFEVIARFDFYLLLQCDGCRIGLSGPGDPRQQATGTTASGEVYLTCDSIDELHARIVDAGVAIVEPIGDRDYGMRDFTAHDPDGNVLTFGERPTMN